MILNVVLAAAIAGLGWQLRQDWILARAREQRILQQRTKPLPPPLMSASKPAESVTPASYSDIAQKMLFTKDRNPTVVVEVAPAPPPKPMPALPVLYGVMNLMDGTTAIMSEKSGAQHLGVRPGDKVGEFKLLAVTGREITLEWEGKTVTKEIDEMIDRATPPPPSGASGTTPRPESRPPAAPPQPPRGEAAPGTDIGNKLRACQPGDNSPPGTVSGSYRKVVSRTPFGETCRWEPI